MERDSSSDEEEDRRNLINDNDTKSMSAESRPVVSAFDVEDFRSDTHTRGFSFSFNWWYLFAFVVPLFIVILYVTDIRSEFSSNENRMRESELKALYLLKLQQQELFDMWNRTLGSAGNQSFSLDSSNSSATSDQALEDFKSAVLKQISFNKEIQDVLLLPHQSGNLSSTENEVPGIGGSDFGRCGKVDQRLSERKTIEWKPKSDKYLLAICVSGQMSNHLICLEKHMFFAAVLNRVLVIPSSKVDYQFNKVLDIDHINQCVGQKVAVSFEEFAESKKNHLHINKFICYFSSPEHCFVDEEHVKRLKGLGLSMGKLESPWVEDVKKPSKRSIHDIEAKFSVDDDVIAIGDVFFADVEQKMVMQPGGPLAHKCKTLIEPSQLILLTAQRFVQTFLGNDFAALHFRRHGFLKFCNAKKPSCFYPIPQAADCISRIVEKANTPVIYLSTDAAESETSLLQSLVISKGRIIPFVTRPARNSAEKWDALLYRHGLEGDPQVEAMLDKTICAMSTVFMGASGSTFTEDILRLRKDWGSASVCDEYLCQGEEPNFIADNE